MGTLDKVVTVFAVLIAFLYFSNEITKILGIILIAISVVLVITSFKSFCPQNSILLIKSTKKQNLIN